MATRPLPRRTAANDRLIMSTPYNQLTQRQKDYADLHGLTLLPASPAPAKGSWMQPGTMTQPGNPVPGNLADNVPRPVAPPLPVAVGPTVDNTPAPRPPAFNRNAFEMLMATFANFGLFGSNPSDPDRVAFGNLIRNYLTEGYDADTVSLLLQQSEPYKKRFSANDARKSKGLRVLSPAEYLGLEESYRRVLRANGLPAGFYDDPKSDFAKWIEGDVSPAEVQDRAEAASRLASNVNPETRAALAQYYGIDDGHIAAYYLDEKRALPILKRMEQAAMFGGAALRNKLAAPTAARAEGFVDQGVSAQQARQGYSEIGGFLDQQKVIAERFGQTYSQADAENEIFGGLASARRKREDLNRSERSLFAGSGAVGRGSLAPPPGSY